MNGRGRRVRGSNLPDDLLVLRTPRLAGTRAALDNGQVHELLLVASPDRLEGADGAATANELVTKARQTDARVTFIEDAALLAEAGGVGALLRYRLHRRSA